MFHTVNSLDILALMECVLLLEDVVVYKNVTSVGTKCSLQDNGTFGSKSKEKIWNVWNVNPDFVSEISECVAGEIAV